MPTTPRLPRSPWASAKRLSDHKELQRRNQEQAREIRRLERELRKKEKALAEAAALLMVSEKCKALWPQDGES